MATLQKQYLHKISRGGVFLGVLQNVTSQFGYSQTINSAGASMEIQVGSDSYVAPQSVDTLITESGDDIITESGDNITTERQPDIVGNSNSQSLIRNYNDVEVYEFSPNNPNGKIVFKGYISKWRASFGGANIIWASIVSYGAELDNYLILGAQTLDVSQASQNANQGVQAAGDKSAAFVKVGQTFVVGAGASPLSAVLLKLANTGSAETITVKLWDSVASANSGGTPLATASQSIPNSAATDYTFTFTAAAVVTVGSTLFFTVEATTNVSAVVVYYQNTSVYASGSMYVDNYGGAGPDPGYLITPIGAIPDSDLYFKTYYTAGATVSPYASFDPAAILESIIDNYVSRGGTINYSAATVDLTSTTVSYTFKVNTVLEGIKKCLELAPNTWYFYVDPATNLIYFKQTATTAAHTMILGRHIKQLDVEANVEELKNVVYFSGGPTAGVNLFTSLTSATSLAANKVGMQRLSDNRVTTSNPATAIMQNFLNNNSSESYNTSIEVLETAYDITLFKLGQNIGFGGFGNFVDALLLQIVGIKRYPDSVVLNLGVLPRRATESIETIIRELNDQQTIDNPTAPS